VSRYTGTMAARVPTPGARSRRHAGVALLVASLGAGVLLADAATTPIRIAGPMNLWPPPPAWLLAGAAVAGAGVAAGAVLARGGRAAAPLLAAGGLAVAVVAARNHARAPSFEEELRDGRYVAPPAATVAGAQAAAAALLVAALAAARRRARR